jgi:menaquinone-specific isochorismate synthase
MHLRTPIAARLAKRAHVLDLVAALHPTPSVGGVPTDRAIEWITRNEPDPRGWYAGPVGWFDAEGDGEFAVALRCGLLRGNRAWIYAGAGIVRDSDPAMEYAETNIKQTALLRALGIGP